MSWFPLAMIAVGGSSSDRSSPAARAPYSTENTAVDDPVGLWQAPLGVAGLERRAALLDRAARLPVDHRDVPVPEIEQVRDGLPHPDLVIGVDVDVCRRRRRSRSSTTTGTSSRSRAPPASPDSARR